MKLYDENFLKGLDDDPKIALHSICVRFIKAHAKKETKLNEHLEAYALIEAFISANDMDIPIPPLPNERNQRVAIIVKFVSDTHGELTKYVQSEEEQKILQNFKGEFAAHIEKSFTYEFSDGDLEKIQNLLNELRDLVTKSNAFEEKHRRRLLKRVERLQQELHKKQSDLDHFWGLVGDAGIVLGKFGEDAKPIVDRIKEITDIVWRTQSRAEELPTDSKPALLGSDSEI